MKLRVPDASVLGGIIQEKRGEVFPRVGIAYGNIAEVGHFQQFGAALGDLALIVFHGMEVGTGWKYRSIISTKIVFYNFVYFSIRDF